MEAVAGADVGVVDPEAVVDVVTADLAPPVVVLELLVPPQAASSRDRAPSPMQMRMFRRIGDPLTIARRQECASDRNAGTGHGVRPQGPSGNQDRAPPVAVSASGTPW